MHMYHSWGSQNAWLRQITAENRLYIHRDLGARPASDDEDWVWIASHMGRVKCQVRLMDGVNPHTVWTWNAIGKRKGAWSLDEDAPEVTRGSCSTILYQNSCPRGRWLSLFELRSDHRAGGVVRPARVHRKGRWRGRTEPRFEALGRGGLPGPGKLAYGKRQVERA
jgi:anaerobic selenocysteine-containing dehydrogenase